MQRFRILNLSIQIKVFCISNPFITKLEPKIRNNYIDSLKHLGRQGDDLHVSFIAKLSGNRTENTGTAGLVGVVQQYNGIVVEADVRTVAATELLLRSNNNSFGYGAFFHTATGDGVFYRYYNLIAYTGIVLTGVAEHADAEYFFGTAVICYVQP